MANFLQRLTMAAVLVGGVTALAPSTAQAGPEHPGLRRTPARRGFQLFAGASKLSLEVNRFYCGLTDAGNVCTDVTGSPVLGGGSWPRGTPDQYVFNTGIQIAGIVPSNAGFAWAGDTVGAWAIDTRGPAEHMQGLTGIYNSLNLDDQANWPSAAFVRDTSLYAPSLIGRSSISQQDTWVRYWDGAPSLVTGRRHTMGILVEQRSLAWNFPTGNQDLIYFIFRFTNITARASSGVYNGLANLGYSAGDIADVGALGDQFQNQSEAAFNVAIPDAGYSINNVFVAFTADMDVGDATNNYATAALPFSLGVTWKSDWREASWQFPGDIFAPPFAATPGFVGVKYLKSPINPATNQEFGISIFSTYTNPSAPNSLFPDPLNIYQGYRYISGTAGPPSDNSCQYAPSRHLCFLGQSPSDQRFMESSGPFNLAPGQSSVIVVAYMAAPVLATNGTFALAPLIGNTNLIPGIVPAGDRLLNPVGPTQDTLRLIDRAMGWVSHADSNGNGVIEQGRTVTRGPVTVLHVPSEIKVVRGSLLDKALVAQGVFDNQFLLPFAPEAPNFYLVPSNNRVTVVWSKSNTETIGVGDPYFAVASNPGSGQLYDPNFKRYDVEGYRVWRGRSPASLEMIAQFDYVGTVLSDYNGAFYNGDYNDANGANKCAPELGIISSCPAVFAANPVPASPHHDIPLSDGGPAFPGAVQIPLGGRVPLANGTVLITVADTAVTGGGSGFPSLTDTGVPFALEDNSVRNGYRYFYAVTAFDVNSLSSGPTSLSSPLVAKSITPRSPSGQETAGFLGSPEFVGSNNQPVTPIAMPTINATTGIFSGPMPQASVDLGFAAFVPQIVNDGALSLKVIDVSATSGNITVGANGTFTLVVQGSAAPDTMVIPVHAEPLGAQFGANSVFAFPFAAGNASQSQSTRFGGDSTYLLYANLGFTQVAATYLTTWGRGDINGAPSNSSFNGPRWWTGSANEATTNPNGGLCAPASGGCIAPPNINLSAGALTGVTNLMHLQAYQSIPSAPYRDMEVYMSFYARSADFKVYWGTAGKIDSVVDVVHNLPLAFNDGVRASWGILNDSSFTNTTAATTLDANNARLTWADVLCVKPYPPLNASCGGAAQTPAFLMDHAKLTPIAVGSSLASTAGVQGIATTGNGFIFYLNGHFFMMSMTTLPASGTVWNARFYSGTVRGAPGSFSFVPQARPINIPGLRVRIAYQGAAFDPSTTTADEMSRIHTVPDPYYVTNNAEITTNSKVLRFVNLPAQAIVRIYSVSGILVNIVTHNDATAGGEALWNLRNRNNQFVASGVYFYHVEAPDGKTKVGRFTVVNYAQ